MTFNYKFLGCAFAVLTLVAIVWQHYGMTRSLYIDRLWPYVEALDDSEVGGTTTSSLAVTDDGLLLSCELSAGYQWPFCELAIFTRSYGWPGFDLSEFDTVELAVEYQSPGVDRLRVALRHFDPAYSVPGDIDTQQVNEIEFHPSRHQVLTLPMSHFQVASWWRQQREVPVEHAAPRFDNITQITVTTGGQVVPGRYQLLLKHLEFRGKWISAEDLYRALLVGWLSLVLAALVWELRQHRRRLGISQRRETELETANRSLELETEKYQRLATRDLLTGVPNRAGIRERLLQEVEESRDQGRPLAGLFIDIDHFKQINDNHGHQAGDQILSEFAQLIARHVRESDLFARWGGEEFLLLCPNTSLRDAARLADKLRQLTANHRWPHQQPLSASFGVTEFGREDVADFFNRADRALYQAKEGGRDRVVVLTADDWQDIQDSMRTI